VTWDKIIENLRFTRISTRITILLVLILVLTFGFYTTFTIFYGQYRNRNVLVEQTIFLAKTVERIVRVNMLENLRDEIQSTINEIHKDEDIRQIRIHNHPGNIAYSSDIQLIGKSINIEETLCQNCHTGLEGELKNLETLKSFAAFNQNKNELTIDIPIFNSESCSSADCHIHSSEHGVLGILSIDVQSQRLFADLRLYRIFLISISSIIILLTAVVVYLLLRHWVWQPVQKMVEGTRRIANGNLDEPIPSGQAEIGELAEAFNNMQAQMKVSQKYLLMCEKLASVGKLAAGVAHEINNPLTGILTFSESLLEESPAGDPRRPDYEVIRDQSLRSREIVRKILDFAKQDEPHRKYVQIKIIVEKTVNLVRRLSQFQNIQIITRYDDTTPEILVDSSQIEQVVLNMLINSSEAISSGGKIEIATSYNQSARELSIQISDNGHGIDKENLTKIFDPFFSTKKDSERSNSGLGLSVSWGIVEQHGGRIEVDSKIGQGTTFRIILPIANQG